MKERQEEAQKGHLISTALLPPILRGFRQSKYKGLLHTPARPGRQSLLGREGIHTGSAGSCNNNSLCLRMLRPAQEACRAKQKHTPPRWDKGSLRELCRYRAG